MVSCFSSSVFMFHLHVPWRDGKGWVAAKISNWWPFLGWMEVVRPLSCMEMHGPGPVIPTLYQLGLLVDHFPNDCQSAFSHN